MNGDQTILEENLTGSTITSAPAITF